MEQQCSSQRFKKDVRFGRLVALPSMRVSFGSNLQAFALLRTAHGWLLEHLRGREPPAAVSGGLEDVSGVKLSSSSSRLAVEVSQHV